MFDGLYFQTLVLNAASLQNTNAKVTVESLPAFANSSSDQWKDCTFV